MGNVSAAINHAKAKIDQGEHLAAIQFLTEKIEKNPRQLALYALRARIYLTLGGSISNYSCAVADYTHILQKNSENREARRGRAHALFAMEDFYQNEISPYLNVICKVSYSIIKKENHPVQHAAPSQALEEYTHLIETDPENIEAYRDRAKVYLRFLNYDAALIDYTAILRKKSDDQDACKALICVYLGLKQYEHALADCIRFLESYPDDKEVYRAQICAHLGLQHYQAVIDGCTTLLVSCPDDIPIYWKLACAYLETNNHDQATKSYTEIIRRSPNDLDAYIARSKISLVFERGRYFIEDCLNIIRLQPSVRHQDDSPLREMILDGLSRLFLQYPEDIETCWTAAQIYGALNAPAKAIEAYSHILQHMIIDQARDHYRFGNVLEVYRARARAYAKLENHLKSVEDYTHIITANPQDIEASQACAESYFALKNYYQVVQVTTRIIQQIPDDIQAYRTRLRAYIELKNHQKIVDDCTQLIIWNPNDIQLYQDRIEANSALRRDVLVVADYTAILERCPGNLEVYRKRLDFHRRWRNYPQIIVDATRLLSCDVDNLELYQIRADAYSCTQAYRKAIGDYTHVIRLNPQHLATYKDRAKMHLKLNEEMAALEDYDQIINLDPADCDAHRGKAKIYLESGHCQDYHLAIKIYNRLIELNPNDLDAYKGRLRAHIVLNVADEILLDDYNQIVRLNPNDLDAYQGRLQAHIALNVAHEILLDDYNQIIRLCPNDLEAYRGRLKIHLQLNIYWALEDYNQIIRLCPNDLEAYQNRLAIHLRRNDDRGALVDYNQIIRLRPNLADYESRLKINLRLNNDRGALDDYNKIIGQLEAHTRARKEAEQKFKVLDRARKEAEQKCEAFDRASKEKRQRWAARTQTEYAELRQALSRATCAVERHASSAGYGVVAPQLSELAAYEGRLRIRLKLKDYQGALEDCDQIFRLNPKAEVAYEGRAECYSALQNLPQACAAYTYLITEFRRSDYKKQRARIYFSFKQYQNVISDYSENWRNMDAEDYENLATAYLRCQQYENAIQVCERASLGELEREAREALRLHQQGEPLRQRERFQKMLTEKRYVSYGFLEVMREANEFIVRDASYIEAYKARAEAYGNAANFLNQFTPSSAGGAAMRVAIQCCELSSNTSDHAQLTRYCQLKAAEYYQKAAQDYTKVLYEVTYANDMSLYRARGDIFFELQKYTEAIRDYTKILEGGSSYDRAVGERRGDAFFKLSRYQNAIEDYTRILNTSFDINVAEKRAETFVNLRKYAEAVADYTQILRATRGPNNAILAKRMRLYDQMGNQHANVIADATQVLISSPDDKAVYQLRLKACLALGKKADAITDYVYLMRLIPAETNQYKLKCAQLYVELKNYLKAVEDYTFVIQRCPTDLDTLAARANCYEQLAAQEKATLLKENYWKKAEADYSSIWEKREGDQRCQAGLRRIELARNASLPKVVADIGSSPQFLELSQQLTSLQVELKKLQSDPPATVNVGAAMTSIQAELTRLHQQMQRIGVGSDTSSEFSEETRISRDHASAKAKVESWMCEQDLSYRDVLLASNASSSQPHQGGPS